MLKMVRFQQPIRLFLLAGAIVSVAVGTAIAQEVSASLSSDVTAPGQPVQLQIDVKGSGRAEVEPYIKVDGLEIHRTGESMQFQMLNFQMSQSVVYTYTVLGMREGTFTIPSIKVIVNGKTTATQPLKLRVDASAGGAPRSLPPPQMPGMSVQQVAPPPRARPGASGENDRLAYADLIIPKRSAYVGETVPVEIRYYFDARFPFQVRQKPEFGGEGFTALKLGEPEQKEQEIRGVPYNVVVFRTAITAIKPGKLEVPPSKLDCMVQVPGQAPQGVQDLFNMLGQGAPQGMFGDTRQIQVKSDPGSLEIKPLPVEGKPEDFSGAIGQFTMKASATPKEAGPGEPITLRVNIAGQGNFESFSAPMLTNDAGWRSYPPSDKFDPSDSIGFSGVRSFETMIIAREAKTQTPGISFSFFDPIAGKYETITAAPVAVKAEAPGTSPVAQASAAPVAAQPSSSPKGPTPTPAAHPGNIPALAASAQVGQFAPAASRRGFWIANVIAALVLFALVASVVVARHRRSASYALGQEARRIRKVLASLSETDLDAGAFYERAAEIGLAIRARGEGRLTPEESASLDRIGERADEFRYAAFARAGGKPLGAVERQETIALLTRLEAGR